MHSRINLNGTSRYVIHAIIDNNIANGISSTGIIYDESNCKLFEFKSKNAFHDWWNQTYDESKVGRGNKYVLINNP